MFEYKKINNNYWITSDKIKWDFWPFKWVFVRNKYLWEVDKYLIDEKEFPWYKYSIWIWYNNLFIIWLDWIENVLKL